MIDTLAHWKAGAASFLSDAREAEAAGCPDVPGANEIWTAWNEAKTVRTVESVARAAALVAGTWADVWFVRAEIEALRVEANRRAERASAQAVREHDAELAALAWLKSNLPTEVTKSMSVDEALTATAPTTRWASDVARLDTSGATLASRMPTIRGAVERRRHPDDVGRLLRAAGAGDLAGACAWLEAELLASKGDRREALRAIWGWLALSDRRVRLDVALAGVVGAPPPRRDRGPQTRTRSREGKWTTHGGGADRAPGAE